MATTELEPLFLQEPKVIEYLRATLEFRDSAWAEVRLGSHFNHLGGARVGPYLIEAWPKYSERNHGLKIVLCTDARFIDKNGKEIKKDSDRIFQDAVGIKEKLIAVMIRESNDEMPVACPPSI